MTKSTLKQLAKTAKNRMKNGYVIDDSHSKSTIPSIEKEEKRVYAKIIEMQNQNKTVFNPLGRLVEHEIYDKLDNIQKERYVLSLSNTYLKMLDKYNKANE